MITKPMTRQGKWQISQRWGLALLLLGMAGCATSTASSPDTQPAVATGNSPAASPVATSPSVPAFGPTSSKPTIPTTFKCVQHTTGWATIAQRGNSVSQSPLLTWNSAEFGPEWTAEQRCQTVSERLTDAAAKNGGRLGGLDLTTGKVDNGYTVVCVVGAGQKSCDRQNMLFTLNKQNTQAPSQILVKITNFASGAASNSPVAENGSPQFIPLETLVNRVLEKESGF
ncbi:COP23 domain-containing protein [Microcoleus sp. A006_D1]|uniref:COP23 domain-containing protein n=1 Tax=Microcoleus sp. A006_D1 TaxID=3055267 RepID=UPI002FCEDC82